MFKHILSLVFLLSTLSIHAQGWERIYSGGALDEARDVVSTADGGYIFTGYYALNSLLVTKVDIDGFQQWTNTNLVSGGAGNAIIATQDSGFVIAGYAGSGTNRNALLLKIDAQGNKIWQKNLGITGEDILTDVQELADGSLIALGFIKANNGDARLIKTDATGNILWSKTFGSSDKEEFPNALLVMDNGDFVMVGSQDDPPTPKDIYVVRTDGEGIVIWTKTVGIGANTRDEGRGAVIADDGDIVIAGITQVSNLNRGLLVKISATSDNTPLWFQTFDAGTEIFNVAKTKSGDYMVAGFQTFTATLQDAYIAKTDEQGSLIWKKTVGKEGPDQLNAVVECSDGGAVGIGASSADLTAFATYAYMAKTDANGDIFTNYIEGSIYFDENGDNIKQAGEAGLKSWIMRIASPDFTRYATSDNNGNYRIMVDTGLYNITLYTPNANWGASQPNLSVNIDSFYKTTTVNVGAKVLNTCPYNEVDIQTPILRRCANNTYTVRYCNRGTSPSANTTVTLELSPALTITGSSKPFVILNGLPTFPLGLLNPGECGTFTVETFLDCDAELTTAHCVEAHIRPDTFCLQANWDGSILEASAKCENGKINMYLTNKGTGPLTTVIEYVIIEDIVLLTVPAETVDNLAAGAEMLVWTQDANGSTYRIIAEQSSTYPGASTPTAAIEGCKSDTSTNYTTGFYTMFPEDDAEPFVATDCQETNETTYNPTFLKRGHPKGYDTQRYITSGTDVDYLIHFQNTGLDTVEQVIVRDTLSPWLDPSTVRPGTASHPYDYQLYGDGIVQFTLSGVNLLPNGGAGSEGYVKFRVSQKPNLPENVPFEIFNRAAIYFDFNAPEMSNETMHTVWNRDSFILVQTSQVYLPGADVRVYPNPFVESTTFEVRGVQASEFQLEIFDAQGRAEFNQVYTNNPFRLYRHQLTPGLHFYRLAADGQPVASGKMLVPF